MYSAVDKEELIALSALTGLLTATLVIQGEIPVFFAIMEKLIVICVQTVLAVHVTVQAEKPAPSAAELDKEHMGIV